MQIQILLTTKVPLIAKKVALKASSLGFNMLGVFSAQNLGFKDLILRVEKRGH